MNTMLNPLKGLWEGVVYDLPCPKNLSFAWNFGSMLGLCLGVQMVTGWLLTFYYSNVEEGSFSSVLFIMQEVNLGWLMRNFHVNVASIMFGCMYVHVGRGLYYGSYRLFKVWVTGVLMLLLTMLTAFTGYVLPWGQMSYWAAQVITSLVTVIPDVGGDIAMWIWGGWAVGGITLKRFFSVHFVLPFLILAVFALHVAFLHSSGSGNPLGVSSDCCLIRFSGSYSTKDSLGFVLLMGVAVWVGFFYPFVLVDAENFIPCEYMLTPLNIHPEWYFLFAYTILRSVPNKAGGIVLMLMSILVLLLVPGLPNRQGGKEGVGDHPASQFLFWVWVMNFGVLTLIGLCGVEEPFISWGQYSTGCYFSYFKVNFLFKWFDEWWMGEEE